MRLYSVDGTVDFSILVRAESPDEANDIVLSDAHLWEVRWASPWIEEGQFEIPEVETIMEELEVDGEEEEEEEEEQSDDPEGLVQ